MPKWIVCGEATVRIYVDVIVEAETKSEAKVLAEGLLYKAAHEGIISRNFDIYDVDVLFAELLDDEEEEG